MKKNVAVVFGGSSQEHDVSVVSAQQLMDAADVTKVNIIPVYLDFENRFTTGPALRKVGSFRPAPTSLFEVNFAWGDDGPVLRSANGSDITSLDCVLPVFHGPFGEDGRIQGYFELLGIPVTGFSAANSAFAMRKDVTKALVRSEGVNVLEHITVGAADLEAGVDLGGQIRNKFGFPVVVKPANLGSSIGVGIAKDAGAVVALVKGVLRLDTMALIEPKVENLKEFNISMVWRDGEVKFSAIESPKSGADLLDFREKYLSSDGGGQKGEFKPSEGMLSLTRDIDPEMPIKLREEIYNYSRKAFVALGRRGAPRIDFMSNQETGELWFNEINPIPGSYGFFLWEAASQPLLYPELIDHLIEEATHDTIKSFTDPVPEGARLFQR